MALGCAGGVIAFVVFVRERELEPQGLRLKPTTVGHIGANGLGRVREPVTNLRSPTEASRLLRILGTWRSSPEVEARHQSVCDIGRDVLFHVTLIQQKS